MRTKPDGREGPSRPGERRPGEVRKDEAMFPGRGERELWERVLDRNISTVRALTQLGLPSCFAMVAFVIGQPSRAQIEVSRC